jgi:hypothetical protein
MAIRKFLTSVADVYGYDNTSGDLVFAAKTLLDSSVDVTLGSTPIRGGRGSQLEYVYYHTAEMKIALTDTQWNLAFLGKTVGSTVGTGPNAYVEENVTVAYAAPPTLTATVAGTPLQYYGETPFYGWVTLASGSTYRGTFSGQSFSATITGADAALSLAGTKACIRYYEQAAAAQYITVSANIIPGIVRLVMETQLNSADVTTNKIGVVQIVVPTATLSGAFNIAMKSDGVSNTPLSALALAYNGAPGTDACASAPYYARISEILDSAHWYDNVIGLSVAGGDFDLAHATTTTLDVWAVPISGAAFRAPLTVGGVAQLAFVSGTPSNATVVAGTGVVTGVTTGTSLITCGIVAVPLMDTSVTVNVT